MAPQSSSDASPKNPGTPSVSEAPVPSDLWSAEALAELAALAEEVLPRQPPPFLERHVLGDNGAAAFDRRMQKKPLRTLCPVKPEGSLFGIPLIACPNQPEHNPMTFLAGRLDGACLYPFSPCASADPAGGEPALKE